MTWEQSLLKDYLFANGPLESLHLPSLKPLLDPLTIVFHHLGSSLFFMALVAVVYLCIDRKLGLRIALALLFAGIINGAFKAWLTMPRPIGLTYPSELGLMEGSYGFPSGHVQTAVALYGTIFLHTRIPWLRVILGFTILFMPIARMYAGLHFLGDVIGGALLGLFVLFSLEYWFKKNPSVLDSSFAGEPIGQNRLKSYIMMIIAATLPTVLLVGPGQPESTSRSWDQVISAAGALAGFGIGILQNKKAGIDWGRAENLGSILVRIGIIILGILIFYLLLGKLLSLVLPENPVARYFRYGIVCYYIGYLSPFLLKRIRGGTYLQ